MFTLVPAVLQASFFLTCGGRCRREKQQAHLRDLRLADESALMPGSNTTRIMKEKKPPEKSQVFPVLKNGLQSRHRSGSIPIKSNDPKSCEEIIQ